MRYCENETVKVFEAVGMNLSELLTDVADAAAASEAEDNSYMNVHTTRDLETLEYYVTLYVHA